VFLSIKDGDDWEDQPIRLRKGRVRLPSFNTEADVYFCPNVFKEPHRKREFALPTVWLHADLDEVDPQGDILAPTAAWETSAGRYQCLWRVTKPLKVKHFEVLNQRLTYLTGADRGGWSVTKVLRVPGSFNHKRGEPERVTLMWEEMQDYLPKTVLNLVRDVKVVRQVAVEKLELPDVTADALYHKYRRSLPARARQLLRARKTKVGMRSERLWELECLLLNAGVSPEECLILVRETVWNKYAGQRRELVQLWTEIKKAEANQRRKTRRDDNYSVGNGRVHVKDAGNGELGLVTYDKFMSNPPPAEVWTVEGVWSHEAHGLIAGEPKTYKSILSTDLAVSVASGTPFLGHFGVPKTGPVIIIQEENSPAMMWDRFHKIVQKKQLGGLVEATGNGSLKIKRPESLPIHLMNGEGFNLYDEDHLDKLQRAIKKIRPKLLVLDPLYMMAPGMDENSSSSVTPLLRGLLQIKQKYDVGILIVHHYNKPREGDDRHPGLRISGSSVFYRWFESAIYLEKGTDPGDVKMTAEHRGHGAPGYVHLEIEIEDEYDVHVEIRKGDGAVALKKTLLATVRANPKGIPISGLMDEMGLQNRDKVKRLAEKAGCPMRVGKGTGRGRPPMLIFPPKVS
jgi:hypothetical protein